MTGTAVGAVVLATTIARTDRSLRPTEWDACYQERIQDVAVDGVAPIREGCRKVHAGTEQDVRVSVVAREVTYVARLVLADRGRPGAATMDDHDVAVQAGYSVCSAAAVTGRSRLDLERHLLEEGTPASALQVAAVSTAFQYLCPEMAR